MGGSVVPPSLTGRGAWHRSSDVTGLALLAAVPALEIPCPDDRRTVLPPSTETRPTPATARSAREHSTARPVRRGRWDLGPGHRGRMGLPPAEGVADARHGGQRIAPRRAAAGGHVMTVQLE